MTTDGNRNVLVDQSVELLCRMGIFNGEDRARFNERSAAKQAQVRACSKLVWTNLAKHEKTCAVAGRDESRNSSETKLESKNDIEGINRSFAYEAVRPR